MLMKKILNTFKYGDTRTKLILILTILSGIGTIALFVFTFIFEMMLLFFGGVICAFITISLAQTFGIKQDETHIPPGYVVSGNIDTVAPNDGAKLGTPDEVEDAEEEYSEDSYSEEEEYYQEERQFEAEEEYYEQPETQRYYQEETSQDAYYQHEPDYYQEEYQNDAPSSEYYGESVQEMAAESQVNMSPEAEDFFRQFERNSGYEEAEDIQEEQQISDDVEEPLEKTAKKKKHFNFYRFLSREEELDDTPKKKSKKKKRKNKKIKTKKEKTKKKSKQDLDEYFNKDVVYQMTDEEAMSRYDKKIIKKVMHKYKVKRDHRMAIVDHCEKLNIKQTAAYIWVADRDFHMLLIDKEPRYFTLPLYNLNEITYKKKVPANAQIDYGAFKGNSVVANLFDEYLPDYTYSTVVDDLTSYKNLYGIGPGIYFTNNSAYNLFDLLGAAFIVEDKVTTSTKVNDYFKDCYKANIMLRDNVIDANGYADKISKILNDMCHSTISYTEFKETLNLLIKNKLITEEFASYFMDVRDKISR